MHEHGKTIKNLFRGIIMKSPEQIKGAIRNIAKKTGANPNSLLQMCLFEGILEKIAKSKYKRNLILKGGLLISSLIGVDMRSTMDMDATIQGLPVNEVTITSIIREILEMFIVDKSLKELWNRYIRSNPYAKSVKFIDTIEVYNKIGEIVMNS